jgi:hypothetical protein
VPDEVVAGAGVGQPRVEHAGFDLGGGAGVDPPTHRVLGDDGGVAAAQVQAGVGLPVVDEPADLTQLGGAVAVGEQREPPAGADR